jgi:hypothetical protein
MGVLKQFGCVVSHAGDAKSTIHAVRGSFRARGSRDLAVLCERQAGNVLVVFWGSGTAIGDTLLSGDIDANQELFRADRGYIIEHLLQYGEGNPGIPQDRDVPGYERRVARVITHDGIGLIFGECCSGIQYWTGKRWVSYPGAD